VAENDALGTGEPGAMTLMLAPSAAGCKAVAQASEKAALAAAAAAVAAELVA
jgi:hypothetical protein